MICGIFNAAAGNPKLSRMGGGTGRPGGPSAVSALPRGPNRCCDKNKGEKGQPRWGWGSTEPSWVDGTCVLPSFTEHHPKSLSLTHRLGQCRAEGWEHKEVGKGSGLRER